MTDITSAVNPLFIISKQVNDASERAGRILDALDQKLEKAGIGIRVFLDEPTITDTVGGKSYSFELGYDKTTEGWAICVARHEIGEPFDLNRPDTYPLRSANRRLRLEFIEHVPRLLEMIQQGAREHLKLAERQKKLLDALENQVGPPAARPGF